MKYLCGILLVLTLAALAVADPASQPTNAKSTLLEPIKTPACAAAGNAL